MIISPETFYNISAVLHIALLVWITVLIFSSVIVALAKVRALRDLKSVKTKMEAMIDKSNFVGTSKAPQELQDIMDFADFGAAPKIQVSMEEVDLSQAPKEVQDMVAKMRGNGFKGDVQAIRVKLPKPQTAVKRKRTAVKKVAKKIIKKKNK